MIGISSSVKREDVEKIEEPDFSVTMENIGRLMLESVEKNFRVGGRPTKWPSKKNGQPSYLIKTGKLFWSIHSTTGKDFARVETGSRSEIPYIFVHQYGTPPQPQRQYMMLQNEDTERFKKMISFEILSNITQKPTLPPTTGVF